MVLYKHYFEYLIQVKVWLSKALCLFQKLEKTALILEKNALILSIVG